MVVEKRSAKAVEEYLAQLAGTQGFLCLGGQVRGAESFADNLINERLNQAGLFIQT